MTLVKVFVTSVNLRISGGCVSPDWLIQAFSDGTPSLATLPDRKMDSLS